MSREDIILHIHIKNAGLSNPAFLIIDSMQYYSAFKFSGKV